MPRFTKKRVILVSSISLLLIATIDFSLQLYFGDIGLDKILDTNPGDGRCVGLKAGSQTVHSGFKDRSKGVLIKVNEMGYRGQAYPYKKGDDVIRVSILGDSTTFGNGVEEEGTFPHLLEKSLKTHFKDKKEIQVLNFGIPGSNLEENVKQYKHFAQKWESDIVLYAAASVDLKNSYCQQYGFIIKMSEFEKFAVRNSAFAKLILFLRLRKEGRKPIIDQDFERRIFVAISEMMSLTQKNGSKLGIMFLGKNKETFLKAYNIQDHVPFLDLEQDLAEENTISQLGHLTKRWNGKASEFISQWLRQTSFLSSQDSKGQNEMKNGIVSKSPN